MTTTLTLLGGLAAAITLGGMVFFAAGIAPLVFRILEEWTAARFIRALFPVYYLFMVIASAVAGLALLPLQPVWGVLLLAVAAGFVVARQVIVPATNRHRDLELAGGSEAAAAGRRFALLHLVSVLLNLAQMVGVAVVLGLLLAA